MTRMRMTYAAFEHMVANIDRALGQKWAEAVDPDRLAIELVDLGELIEVFICLRSDDNE